MMFRPLRILVFILFMSATVGAQSPPGISNGEGSGETTGRMWAVVIGVSRYQYLPSEDWLSSCHKDAEAVAKFLRSPRGGSIAETRLKLLVDQEATARNIRVALDRVINGSGPGDTVFVFYAGHGKVRPYGGGEAAYLLAYDTEPDLLNATAIPMDEIHRYVDVHLKRAAQVILITDACHAGAIKPIGLDTSLRTRSIAEYLQAVGERMGVLNLMACRRDEVAYEDTRLGGHGVLTYAFLRALNGHGSSTRDGVVRIQDVLEYVSYQVPRLTNQKQHPRYSTNYKDEFPLANLSKGGPELNLPEPPSNELASYVGGAQATSVFSRSRKSLTLKVIGAQRLSELYLVKEGQQLTVGTALSPLNTLVVQNVTPGEYTLVQLLDNGQERRWDFDLTRNGATFDVRSGTLK